MKIEVTKEEFDRFVRVQESGMVNMMSPDVQDLADISKEVHMAIMGNYEELAEEYS